MSFNILAAMVSLPTSVLNATEVCSACAPMAVSAPTPEAISVYGFIRKSIPGNDESEFLKFEKEKASRRRVPTDVAFRDIVSSCSDVRRATLNTLP